MSQKIGVNGNENGNYYSMLGLYRDNGKGKGYYSSILGVIWGKWDRTWKLLQYIGGDTGKPEKTMETGIVSWGLYGDNRNENGNYCDGV